MNKLRAEAWGSSARNGIKVCYCIGAERCGDKNCKLVQDYQANKRKPKIGMR
jgi:hypothetical protein